VRRDSPDTIFEALRERAGEAGDPRLIVTFPLTVPKNFSEAEVRQLLEQQGYTRIHSQRKNLLEVVQDRLRMSSAERPGDRSAGNRSRVGAGGHLPPHA
jgi:excinuclease ABC subunit A